jgi:hypothetical protein
MAAAFSIATSIMLMAHFTREAPGEVFWQEMIISEDLLCSREASSLAHKNSEPTGPVIILPLKTNFKDPST